MLKTFTVFISLFTFSFLKYISMGQKEEDIDIDDICYYNDPKYLTSNVDDIEYVKPCEANYYCRQISIGSIGTCEKYYQVIKKLDEDCSSNDECDVGLVCDKKCIVPNNSDSFAQEDLVTGSDYYYCPSYSIPIEDSSSYICKPREEVKMDNLCFLKSQTGAIKASPDYFKVCGQKTITKDSSGHYDHINTTTNYIGSVGNGNFVENKLACESGYTLKFYGDGNTIKPDTETDSNNMFEMCVEVNEVQKYGSNCYINYTIGEKSFIYNTGRVPNSNSIYNDCEFIMTKIKLFKEYLGNMSEIKETCENVRYYDEPFTCGNDKLRKLWYYYNNVDKYLLYKNDEDIINFLIQQKYPLYGFELNETDNKDSSLYLTIKYFSVLLFLLSF